MDTTGPGARPRRVLIGCTGSVAAIKVPHICQRLLQLPSLEVALVLTERSEHFLRCSDLPVPQGVTKVWRDSDEWSTWQARGDPVVHIQLRSWADLLLLAPLDANTLAKLTNGLCDNLLTCVARAWPIGAKPILFAPAMNSEMYRHPITARQIAALKELPGFTEIPVVTKTLMCNETGPGAMAEPDAIVQAVAQALGGTNQLALS